MKLDAEWTDDCQGKKDYDGNILSISTRYWPRGGGFMMTTNVPGKPIKIEDNDARPEIKPSAHSALILWTGDGDSVELTDRHFEADTEEEVKREVEAWAEAVYGDATALLLKAYQKEAKA